MPPLEGEGPSLTEKRLCFRFPRGWRVQKHDGTSHHRELSGRDLSPKGCDIVALGPEGQGLWLIEVKDYRLEGQPGSAQGLAMNLLAKYRDTLASLIGMGQVGVGQEQAFAQACLARLGQREALWLVLHLELAEGNKLFRTRKNLSDCLKRGASGFTTKDRIFLEGGPFTHRGPWCVEPAP